MKKIKIITILWILILGIGQPTDLMGQKNKKNKSKQESTTSQNLIEAHSFTLSNGIGMDNCTITFTKNDNHYYASLRLKTFIQEDIFEDPLTKVKVTFVDGSELALNFRKDSTSVMDTFMTSYYFSNELSKDEITQFATKQYYKFTFIGNEEINIYNLSIFTIAAVDIAKRYNNNIKKDLTSLSEFINLPEDNMKLYTLSNRIFLTQMKMFLDSYCISFYYSDTIIPLNAYIFLVTESNLLIPNGSRLMLTFTDGSSFAIPIKATVGNCGLSGYFYWYAIPMEMTAQQLKEISTKPLLLVNISDVIGSFASENSSTNIIENIYQFKNDESLSKKDLKKYQDIETTIILPNEEWGY